MPDSFPLKIKLLMNIEGLKPKEIQERIFEEIAKGANPDTLKMDLKAKGVPVEGYYFSTKTAHEQEVSLPAEPAGQLTGWQIFWGVVTVIVLVLRIARCSSRM